MGCTAQKLKYEKVFFLLNTILIPAFDKTVSLYGAAKFCMAAKSALRPHFLRLYAYIQEIFTRLRLCGMYFQSQLLIHKAARCIRKAARP